MQWRGVGGIIPLATNVDPSRTSPSEEGEFGMFSLNRLDCSQVLKNHISVQIDSSYNDYSNK